MHKSVLIASPYSSFGELLRTSLEESGNYSAHIVHTGSEATAIAAKVAFDLVILDCDLDDFSIPDLGHKVLELLPKARLVVVPPNNNPLHPLLAGLNAHGYLKRPFYMPSMLKMIDEVMYGQTILTDIVKENKTPEETPYAWLCNPDEAHPFLTQLLKETSSHAIILTRVGKVLLHAGALTSAEADEIANILGKYWDATGKSDLARFIHIDSENGDFLLYAAALIEDLILGLVYDTQTPLSQSRQQTKYMVRLLTTETPESYAEKNAQLEETLDKWIENRESDEIPALQDLTHETQIELMEDRSSANLSEDPAKINPDWLPELPQIQNSPVQSVDVEDDFSLWLEKRNGKEKTALPALESDSAILTSDHPDLNVSSVEPQVVLTTLESPEDIPTNSFENAPPSNEEIPLSESLAELDFPDNSNGLIPEWLEGLIPLPDDRSSFIAYDHDILPQHTPDIFQPEEQPLSPALIAHEIESESAIAVDAPAQTENRGKIGILLENHPLVQEEVMPEREELAVDQISSIVDSLTEGHTLNEMDAPAADLAAEEQAEVIAQENNESPSEDSDDDQYDFEMEVDNIDLGTLLASLPSPDPEVRPAPVESAWLKEIEDLPTDSSKPEVDYLFPWETLPEPGSDGEHQGDTLPVKLTNRAKTTAPLFPPRENEQSNRAAAQAPAHTPPQITSDNGFNDSNLLSGPPSALTHLSYICILIPRIPQQTLTGPLAENLAEWITDLCIAFGWQLQSHSIQPEYMQWVVQVTPTVSPGNLMRIIRQRTSYRIFNAYPNLGEENPSGDFWAPGYLVVSGTQSPNASMLQDFIQQTRRRQGINVKS